MYLAESWWAPQLWLAAGSIGIIVALLFHWVRARLPAKVYIGSVSSLLTPAERLFAETLEMVVAGKWRISYKVRVADILEVSSVDSHERQRLFRRLAGKHIDFLLTCPDTFEPIVAVELDDSSHERAERKERDQFLDELFEIARLPLVRIAAAARYSPNRIFQTLESAIED
jgi:Protein of unknown function (DUF2726)